MSRSGRASKNWMYSAKRNTGKGRRSLVPVEPSEKQLADFKALLLAKMEVGWAWWPSMQFAARHSGITNSAAFDHGKQFKHLAVFRRCGRLQSVANRERAVKQIRQILKDRELEPTDVQDMMGVTLVSARSYLALAKKPDLDACVDIGRLWATKKITTE